MENLIELLKSGSEVKIGKNMFLRMEEGKYLIQSGDGSYEKYFDSLENELSHYPIWSVVFTEKTGYEIIAENELMSVDVVEVFDRHFGEYNEFSREYILDNCEVKLMNLEVVNE